ncbi:unnamed protein product [Bemisia tabaci]|uniref:CCDC92/74 N-terminal domain-containing protein n=1 Tax=Bemisia tabaci TaxID=7038 RepID=A0A9P0EZI7_BEMTA|nr:unnamed protein product [Bemisia tabaci]
MSTKIPTLPLPLSPHHEQLPPLVAHYPRWSRNAHVASMSVILSNKSTNSECGMTVKHTSTGTTSPNQGDSKGKFTPEDWPVLDPYQRIKQLELNIKSLQAQHLIMLTSLHDEIELLRQQNKELQFQLVFKGNSSAETFNLMATKCSSNFSSVTKMLRNTANEGTHCGRKNNRNQSSQRFPPLTHWQLQSKAKKGEWSSDRGIPIRSCLGNSESLDHLSCQMAVSLPNIQNYVGRNYYPNDNHHSHNQNRKRNQRDEQNQNLNTRGFRKHLTGTRGMSQESN